MKRLEASARFDEKLLPELPTTSESLAAHVLKLVQLDPVDLVELMSTDEGMEKISAGMTFHGVDLSLPLIDEVVEAKPGRMTAKEMANVLTGGTRAQPADLNYSRGPKVSKAVRLRKGIIQEAIRKGKEAMQDPYLEAALLPGEKPRYPLGVDLIIDVFKEKGGHTALDQQIENVIHLDLLHKVDGSEI